MATKAELLYTVDKLNDLFGTGLKLKSKTLKDIKEKLNEVIPTLKADHFYEFVDKDSLKMLKEFGIALPELSSLEGKKKDKKKKKKEKKSENSADPTVVIIPDEDNQEDDKVETETEENNKLVAKINKLQRKLANKELTKKKRKKFTKKLDVLLEEYNGLSDNTSVKTKEKSKPIRGASARANRKIPDTISWPRPGTVTDAIIQALMEKPCNIDDVVEVLEKKFPERPSSGMRKTVGALIGGKGEPLPLTYTRGIPCVVTDDGTPERKVFIEIGYPEGREQPEEKEVDPVEKKKKDKKKKKKKKKKNKKNQVN